MSDNMHRKLHYVMSEHDPEAMQEMKEKVVTHKHDWIPFPKTNLGRYCTKCDKRQWKLMTGQWVTVRDNYLKEAYEPPIWDKEYDKAHNL